jgi:DNA polymerase sigma
VKSLKVTEKDNLKLAMSFDFVQEVLTSNPKLNQDFGDFEILMYGSTVNTLAIKGDSDLDLAIVFHSSSLNLDYKHILFTLYQVFKGERRASNMKLLPIKRMYLFRFIDKETGVKVDITLNTLCEIFNSKLIYTYSKIDCRF